MKIKTFKDDRLAKHMGESKKFAHFYSSRVNFYIVVILYYIRHIYYLKIITNEYKNKNQYGESN